MGYKKDKVVYVGDAEQDMIAASQTDISFIGIDKITSLVIRKLLKIYLN